MNAEDKHRLKRLTADLPSGTLLRLSLSGHPHSHAFQNFGWQLKTIAPGIHLPTEISDGPEPPWMETDHGVRLHALPERGKLDSFVEALTPFSSRDAALPAAHRDLLARVRLPTDIRLYIAAGCPHCTQVLQQWITLARAGENLRLHVIDGALFPEMARAENVKSVPTMVVDSHLRWSGRIPAVEVLEQLVSRDPARLSAEALDGIIKEGQAGQVARSMIARGTLFPAITDLLTHDKWPVRLGAMVVMEEIAALDRRLAGQVVPALQARYERLDDPVRGDVLYVIGVTGDRGVLAFLQDIVDNSTHSEVRQAAMEAAAAIGQDPDVQAEGAH